MHIQQAILCGLLTLGLAAPSAAESIFEDKTLEEVVREQVAEKRGTTKPLTAEDVKEVTSVVGYRKQVKSLAGLEHCVALAELRLGHGEVQDLTPLSGLERLQLIDLSDHQIKSVAPLENLSELQYLNLSGNQVEDLKPLAGLKKLNSLYLGRNKIQDVSPLAELEDLWSLSIKKNQIEDISPIAKLPRVSTLDLGENRIQDLSPLREYRYLKLLMLEKNQISDLSPLLAMAQEDADGPKRFSLFWQIYLMENPLSETAAQTQMERLRKLGARIFWKPADS
ncbi:MAG: leucine-rich repeat domain-containing protein [Pirellulaceae bacterium]